MGTVVRTIIAIKNIIAQSDTAIIANSTVGAIAATFQHHSGQ